MNCSGGWRTILGKGPPINAMAKQDNTKRLTHCPEKPLDMYSGCIHLKLIWVIWRRCMWNRSVKGTLYVHCTVRSKRINHPRFRNCCSKYREWYRIVSRPLKRKTTPVPIAIEGESNTWAPQYIFSLTIQHEKYYMFLLILNIALLHTRVLKTFLCLV